MSVVFQILLTRRLSKRIEKIMSAIMGRTIIPRRKEERSANVLVNASGRNSLPSAACIAKTGRKLTTVVDKAVITADDTSIVALYITERRAIPLTPLFSGISRCLNMFSVKMIPTSTITPMAIAIPDNATILASTPVSFIIMNVISTATGSNPEIITEALRLNINTIITIILISTS